jgi:prepilin-type N-terminal cleavage/methylation domain-containing protein
MNETTILPSGPERCPPAPTAPRRLRKALERGVTLVEVLIVVAIIAMVASGVAVFALPRYKEAQIKSAETGARVIRGAIQNWQRINNESTAHHQPARARKAPRFGVEHSRPLERAVSAVVHGR